MHNDYNCLSFYPFDHHIQLLIYLLIFIDLSIHSVITCMTLSHTTTTTTTTTTTITTTTITTATTTTTTITTITTTTIITTTATTTTTLGNKDALQDRCTWEFNRASAYEAHLHGFAVFDRGN